MKSILLIALFLSAFTAAADVNVQPTPGEKTCVGRQYLKEHMNAHPKQLLSKMAIIVEHFPKDRNWDVPHVTAKVVGERGGKLWGNEAGCEYRKDGSLKCQIDCDGGAFTLTPNADSADFKVQKDYYFPLFKQGTNFANPAPSDELDLNYSDLENRSYRLYQADTQSCVEIWAAYAAADHGC